MNNKTVIQTAFLLAVCAGQAGAAETTSPAYIAQVDTGSFSRMSTADIVKPAMEVAQKLSALRPDNGNLALVWQDGVNNSASITQNGSGNVGLIRQIGIDNTASIRQSGSGHQALIVQQGRGNSAFIAQR
jgi:minor curlin subunit